MLPKLCDAKADNNDIILKYLMLIIIICGTDYFEPDKQTNSFRVLLSMLIVID